MIAEPLLPLAVPVGDLRTLPGNPRRGDVDAVARSLARFGQRKPIVASVDGTIIAGNHTYLAAVQLGWDEIAVVRVDDDDATAKAFALADNRTSDLGAYDNDALLDLLYDVRDYADLLEATGYTAADLDAMLGPTPADGSLDDGPIAAQEHVLVPREATVQSLWREALFPLGVELLTRVLADLEAGRVVAVPQDETLATWEPTWSRPPLHRPELPELPPATGGIAYRVTPGALRA